MSKSNKKTLAFEITGTKSQFKTLVMILAAVTVDNLDGRNVKGMLVSCIKKDDTRFPLSFNKSEIDIDSFLSKVL